MYIHWLTEVSLPVLQNTVGIFRQVTVNYRLVTLFVSAYGFIYVSDTFVLSVYFKLTVCFLSMLPSSFVPECCSFYAIKMAWIL
jgi:hypothetical protein